MHATWAVPWGYVPCMHQVHYGLCGMHASWTVCHKCHAHIMGCVQMHASWAEWHALVMDCVPSHACIMGFVTCMRHWLHDMHACIMVCGRPLHHNVNGAVEVRQHVCLLLHILEPGLLIGLRLPLPRRVGVTAGSAFRPRATRRVVCKIDRRKVEASLYMHVFVW